MSILTVSTLSLAVWIYLWVARGSFWRIERDDVPAGPIEWPDVVAVIPARNEADRIVETLRTLCDNDYPRPIRIVVVDDHSDDSTATVAIAAAREAGHEAEIRVLAATELPAGWCGKVWAMHEGVTRGVPLGDPAKYILFSDADICHSRSAVRDLVSRAEATACDLASFMVRLRCHTPAERLTIPAFVFFFRMLYPFRWANNSGARCAAAAGGTMLARRTALERIGGLTAIRGELIDDCALARAVKRGGNRIWIGLARESVSTRGYNTLPDVVSMVARTAYTQLGRSPLALLGCVVGLCFTFLTPPLLTVVAHGLPQALGATAWLLMSLAYLPMVRFYGQSPLWAPLLPVTASVYLHATIVSAWRNHRGVGGMWKGRAVRDEG